LVIPSGGDDREDRDWQKNPQSQAMTQLPV
jgi:hypothetical protein